MKTILASLALALVFTLAALDASAQTLTVTKGVGKEAFGDTTLRRQWYLINDPRVPLRLTVGNPVPSVVPGSDATGRRYQYDTEYTVVAMDQDVRAFELHFLVLDVFGDKQKLLSVAVLADIAPQDEYEYEAAWHLYSATDASTALYSIGYVARVLTKNGQIYKANQADVLKEIQKINSTITASDLEPESAGK